MVFVLVTGNKTDSTAAGSYLVIEVRYNLPLCGLQPIHGSGH